MTNNYFNIFFYSIDVCRSLFCEKCVILNKRPPDRERLMELRSKDLRDYLNKNKISTHGLVGNNKI